MKKLVHHRLHGNKITSCTAKHTYTIDLQDAAMLEKAYDGYKTVICCNGWYGMHAVAALDQANTAEDRSHSIK